MSGGALSGLKVLEYSNFISGSYCTKLLGDLGADIIKIEKPGIGDRAREWGPFPQDIPNPEKSGLFLYLNTNKLGVTLEMGNTMGIKLFKELVKRADVLVENNPPKEIENLGINYETLHKVNPSLVMTSISYFGQTGPYRDYKGSDLISLHASGEAFINPKRGVSDIEKEPPLKLPHHAGDFMTGLAATVCTMSAIIDRRETGRGHHVDLSEQEALAYLLSQQVDDYIEKGTSFRRATAEKGNMSDEFPCKDGYVVLFALTDQTWASLVEIMGKPDWTMTEQCKTFNSRREHWGEVRKKIEEWTSARTMQEVSRMAQAKRIPCSPVNTAKEVLNAEDLAARHYFVDIAHKEAGTIRFPGAPYKLSATPWGIRRPAPLLGEHNEEVYCRMLGYSKQDMAKMRQAGVI